jgi:hypothetical protein
MRTRKVDVDKPSRRRRKYNGHEIERRLPGMERIFRDIPLDSIPWIMATPPEITADLSWRM